MKKQGLITMMFVTIIVTALFAGCKPEELATVYYEDEAEFKIFTTIYPIQFIIEELSEDIIEVQSVYPPGVDAHTFEPTMKDMTEIAKSDAFIYFGQTMEGFVESAAEALKDEPVTLFSLEQYDELFESPQLEQSKSGEVTEEVNRNPHVWIDPLRMMAMTEVITEQLIEIAPEHEQLFEQNKTDLIVQFQKLEKSFKQTIAPKDKKYMIVPHAAYDYWEERYGIEQIAITGLSPTEEPSQKYLTEIIAAAEQYEIDYLFYEQNTPDRLIEIMTDELNAETYTIHNLAVLTEEDLKNEENYITLMKGNIEVLDEVFE